MATAAHLAKHAASVASASASHHGTRMLHTGADTTGRDTFALPPLKARPTVKVYLDGIRGADLVDSDSEDDTSSDEDRNLDLAFDDNDDDFSAAKRGSWMFKPEEIATSPVPRGGSAASAGTHDGGRASNGVPMGLRGSGLRVSTGSGARESFVGDLLAASLDESLNLETPRGKRMAMRSTPAARHADAAMASPGGPTSPLNDSPTIFGSMQSPPWGRRNSGFGMGTGFPPTPALVA